MPLVYAGPAEQEPITDAHERARKVEPRYTRGELVRVAGGRNQAEAELIQNMLLEEGIPSILRRTRGFDVPDFLAAGPRDVLVPRGGEEAARQVLGTRAHVPSSTPPARNPAPPWVRALAVVLAVLLIALVAWGVIAAVLST